MIPEAPIDDLVSAASLEMAEDYNADYDICKLYILTFLGLPDEASLYNIQFKGEGEAISTSLRHVMKNAKKVRAVDIVQAFTTIGSAAVVAPDRLKFSLAATTAGLYFIKAFRDAVTLKLDAADASILWSLNQLGGDASMQDLLTEWRKVVASSDEVDADTSEKKLTVRVNQLVKLGCVIHVNGRVVFEEAIASDSVNPMLP